MGFMYNLNLLNLHFLFLYVIIWAIQGNGAFYIQDSYHTYLYTPKLDH